MRTEDLHNVTKMEGYGKRIPNSKYFRAFCPECLDPVRVTGVKIENKLTVFCETCLPKHIGCTSPLTIVNDVDHDPDAFKPSWKSK